DFFNGYGPTECTIFTTTYLVKRRMKNIPIGKPLDNLRLYVVDTEHRRVPVGAVGELWVSGPQVSRGYLNRPDKQAEVYINNPFDNSPQHSRVYRTGDIVRYLPDGNIEFVGRRDGQVKIRGFRIELKEVEGIIREFPGIKDATVQAFDEESGTGKFIAAYVVADDPVDIEAMNQFILEQKPPYMVPAVTMQIDAIPLNQNMKVNKRALPKPEKKAAAVEHVDVPMNVLEQELHDMIASIVGTSDFGVTTNLGYAGLTSISSIKLAVQVSKKYDVQIDSKSLAKTGTLQMIENAILERLLSGPVAPAALDVPTRPVATSAPLSYAQTGVFFECLKNPTSTIYNIPYLLSFPQGVAAERLAEVVKQVVKAHPELGAHFETRGDSVVQTLDDAPDAEVTVIKMTDAQLIDYKHEFVRPFNLQKAPLYRLEVVETPTGVHLLVDIHHLLFDGGSADMMFKQICECLDGGTVEKEKYTYIDFTLDQQAAEQTEEFRAAQQFFAKKLGDFESASEIPADLNTGLQGFIGEAVCATDHDRASAFCREHDITPAHLYYAASAYV
ncbi:MAG: AMP-binding protein, partial [Muribaculaceae bacterium]|nr:AMP-binding protein [Muribaculaceae bacterium]